MLGCGQRSQGVKILREKVGNICGKWGLRFSLVMGGFEIKEFCEGIKVLVIIEKGFFGLKNGCYFFVLSFILIFRE